MLTIVLTNRNRDLNIVSNCLASLSKQTQPTFRLFLVDYGSDSKYLNNLKQLVAGYTFVELIACPVTHQLWNKSRAINIALRKTDTPYFLVGDIDLIFHPEFVNKALDAIQHDAAIYFKYAFLSRETAAKALEFEAYAIDFLGGEAITGTTLFKTDILKQLNGYDEFYHGWGAEDTDIHIRLRQAGHTVRFIDDAILIKHQWHPKTYRSKDSAHPFHSLLERINHAYMLFTEQHGITKANLHSDWGLLPDAAMYTQLASEATVKMRIHNTAIDFAALLAHLNNLEAVVFEVEITAVPTTVYLNERLKRLLGKKHHQILALQTINNHLLEAIITRFRNKPYQFHFNRAKHAIYLKMVF